MAFCNAILVFYMSLLKLSRLSKATITGMPTAMTTNSPTATKSHVSKKGNSNAMFNSQAMRNIVNVKTIVLKNIRRYNPSMNLADRIVIDRASTDCPTPNTRSIGPSSEKNMLAIKTPRTTPTIYFLLNTTR